MATRLPQLTDALDYVIPACLRKPNRTSSRLHRLRPPRAPQMPPSVREAAQLCRVCYGSGVAMRFDGRRGYVRGFTCTCGAPRQLPAMMQRIVDHLDGTEVLTAAQRGVYDWDADEREMQA